MTDPQAWMITGAILLVPAYLFQAPEREWSVGLVAALSLSATGGTLLLVAGVVGTVFGG